DRRARPAARGADRVARRPPRHPARRRDRRRLPGRADRRSRTPAGGGRGGQRRPGAAGGLHGDARRGRPADARGHRPGRDRAAARPDPGSRLMVTTIVSATMLSKIAAAAGARYAETLTGFKWIVRGGQDRPGSRFLFGYEEALGYAVGDVVRDKDGIGAALAVLGLAIRERRAGRALLDAYDRLEAAHGVHLTAQLTLRTGSPGGVVTAL